MTVSILGQKHVASSKRETLPCDANLLVSFLDFDCVDKLRLINIHTSDRMRKSTYGLGAQLPSRGEISQQRRKPSQHEKVEPELVRERHLLSRTLRMVLHVFQLQWRTAYRHSTLTYV